jgi:hypothetical protein
MDMLAFYPRTHRLHVGAEPEGDRIRIDRRLALREERNGRLCNLERERDTRRATRVCPCCIRRAMDEPITTRDAPYNRVEDRKDANPESNEANLGTVILHITKHPRVPNDGKAQCRRHGLHECVQRVKLFDELLRN